MRGLLILLWVLWLAQACAAAVVAYFTFTFEGNGTVRFNVFGVLLLVALILNLADRPPWKAGTPPVGERDERTYEELTDEERAEVRRFYK